MKNWILKELSIAFKTIDTFIKDAVYTACLLAAVVSLLVITAVVIQNKLEIASETREYNTHVSMNDIRLVINQSDLKILYELEVKDRFILKDKMTITVIGPEKDRSEAWFAIEQIMNE